MSGVYAYMWLSSSPGPSHLPEEEANIWYVPGWQWAYTKCISWNNIHLLVGSLVNNHMTFTISYVDVTVMLWWRWSHLALLLEIKHWWNHTCAKPYQARIARLTLAKHTLVRLAILSSLVCTHDMPKHILYCGWLHITSRTAQFSFVIHTRNWDNQ